jgi:hypothetical protein
MPRPSDYSLEFDPHTFLLKTMGMSDEEVGVYIRFLCLEVCGVGIPNDISQLSKAVQSTDAVVSSVLNQHFMLNEAAGCWIPKP